MDDTIEVKCPHCGARQLVSPEYANRRARCKCGEVFVMTPVVSTTKRKPGVPTSGPPEVTGTSPPPARGTNPPSSPRRSNAPSQPVVPPPLPPVPQLDNGTAVQSLWNNLPMAHKSAVVAVGVILIGVLTWICVAPAARSQTQSSSGGAGSPAGGHAAVNTLVNKENAPPAAPQPRPDEVILRFPAKITAYCWGADDSELYVAGIRPDPPPETGAGEAFVAAFGAFLGGMADAEYRKCPHCNGRGRDPFIPIEVATEDALCGLCKGTGVNPDYEPPERPKRTAADNPTPKKPESQEPREASFVAKINPWTKSLLAVTWLPIKVYGLAYNKRTHRLALAALPRTIAIADPDDLSLLHRFVAIRGDVFDVARYDGLSFSADGSVLAGGDNFQGFTLIRGSDASPISQYVHKFEREMGPMSIVNLHPTGKWIAFGFNESPYCRLFNLEKYDPALEKVLAFRAWSADGQRSVMFCSKDGEEHYNIYTKRETDDQDQMLPSPLVMGRRIHDGHWGPGLSGFTISQTGRYAAALQDGSGLAVLWDLDHLDAPFEWQAGLRSCPLLQFSPDERHVAVSHSHTLRIRSIRGITTRPEPLDKPLLRKLAQALTPDLDKAAEPLSEAEARALVAKSNCGLDQILTAIVLASGFKPTPPRWSYETNQRMRQYLDEHSAVTPSVSTRAKATDIERSYDWRGSELVVDRAWRDLLRYFPQSKPAAIETPAKVLSVDQGRLLLGCEPGLQGQWVCLIEYAPPPEALEKKILETKIERQFTPTIDFPVCRYVELDASQPPVVISANPLVLSLFKDGWLRVKLVNFDGESRDIQ